jgi:hypothetical protein
MLHKCATNGCNTKFKYFGVGLLYVVPHPEKNNRQSSNVEFFWLCERCAHRENESTAQKLPVIVRPALRTTG